MNHFRITGKRLIMSLSLGALLLTAGCGFKDIDKRLFIAAIGVDPAEKMENGYKVTLKVILPFGAIKEAAKPTFTYLSEEAETIGEAVRILETHVDKVLEFGHVKAIIIHEDLLHDNMKTFMDYFVRRGDIQMIAFVAGARPTAEAIVKMEPATEAPASVSLFNFFGDNATESPFIVTTYLYQLRRDFFGKGIDPVVPLMEVSEEQKEFIVNKSLVISEEKKPYELGMIHTKYYNSLYNKTSGFTYKVKNDEYLLLLNIDSVKMKYKIRTEGVRPVAIDMEVAMKGIIGESNQFLKLKDLEKYNQIAETEIKKKVMDFLLDMQKEHLDPLGFGLRYRATHLYNDETDKTWTDAYPDIQFNLKLNVDLKSTGTIE